MLIKCIETCETWDEADLETGDTDKRDAVELEFTSLRDLLIHLSDNYRLMGAELSSTVIDQWTWVTYHDTNMYTGDHLVVSLHIKTIDGAPVTAHQLKRIYGLAEIGSVYRNVILAFKHDVRI
jgi:hypothetical protein